jgi:hypothetical protein
VARQSLQSRLRQEIKQGRLWLVLFLPMAVLGGISLWLSWCSSGWLQALWMNLGFLALGVLVTVFYVDWLVGLHERDRWSKQRGIASIRLRRSATAFLSQLHGLLGFDPLDPRFFIPGWHMRAEPLDAQARLFNNPAWIRFIREEVIPASKRVETSEDADQLSTAYETLERYRNRIREDLALLQGYLSPRQLENLLVILDRIPEAMHATNARRNGNVNFPGPRLEDIAARSLELIEESNRNPNAYVRSVDEMIQD